MTLTLEEQALLDARNRMLAAGEAMDATYAALRSAIATDTGSGTSMDGLIGSAIAFDAACRAYDAAFRAAYDRSVP